MTYRFTKEAMKEIFKEALSDELSDTLNIHSAFTWEKFLNQGIDAHFDARASVQGVEEAATPSDYWQQLSYLPSSDGELKCPSDKFIVSLYTKGTFNIASFETKIPALNNNYQAIFMGLENGSRGGTGISSFWLQREAGIDVFRAVAGGGFTWNNVGITNALPTDYQTVRHKYTVVLLKNYTEFYIDTELVAIILNCNQNLPFSTILHPPYGITGTSIPYSTKMPGLLEVIGNGSELIFPIAPSLVRFGNLIELNPSRGFRIYDAGTSNLFTDLSIAAGSETSHPFPLFGYEGKTIYFQADQAGNFNIEILGQSNNWRVHSTIAFLANTLSVTTINDEAVLGRIVVTPTAFPCNIEEAEVILR